MAAHLIVNADDFGFSDEVNAGVIAAHDSGIVTSASLMVRKPAAERAAKLAVRRPRLALGLHVDLGEWIHTGGDGWVARDVVVDADDAAAVEAEVERQLSTFTTMAGRPPTHLDGHQHVQRHEPARSVMGAAAHRLGIPLRLVDARVTYRGEFYGQGPRAEPHPDGVSVAHLVHLIETSPDGWTELGCHPGLGVDADRTVYAAERDLEVAALTSAPARAAAAAHVVLASFADLLGRSVEHR